MGEFKGCLETEILHSQGKWQHFTVEMYDGGNSFILHLDNYKDHCDFKQSIPPQY